jgi:hypothetical protein
MFLAMAVLLIHPQLATTTPLSGDKVAANQLTAIAGSTSGADSEIFPLEMAAPAEAPVPPAAEPEEELPLAPAPIQPMVASPAPMAYLKPSKPLTISVAELQAENRRQLMLWNGLAIASSGAATFDAWSTRRAITNYGAQELNPLLKPFAGNASLYVAIQVAPALLDFAGRKMMYSRHSWMRRAWWVPQSASFVSSIFCGAHNLSYR